jgi:hydroxyacyl-ACP dehydratase HTD2-like protein with hotdog domain
MTARVSKSTVRVGDALPTTVHQATRVGIFLFAAAHWTPHRIHYDLGQARAEGFGDVVVTGALMSGWATRLLTEWTGDPRCLRELEERNVAVAVAGDTLTISGVVTGLEELAGPVTLARCAYQITRQDDVVVVRGTASVALPD